MTEKQIERFKLEYENQKLLRRQRGERYSYEVLAAELGYNAHGQTVVRWLKNERVFREWESLAKIWNVRTRYLLCIDNFRTNEDVDKFGGPEFESCMGNWIRIIEILGYTVERRLELYVPSWKVLAAQWDAIKLTLTDETLKQPINADGQTFDDWKGKTPINDEYLSNMWVKQTLSGSDTDHYGLDADSKYSLYFVLMKDGKQAFWNVSDLDTVTEKIYEYAEFVTGKAFHEREWDGRWETHEDNIVPDQTQEGRHGNHQ